jgi:hypothetical protein
MTALPERTDQCTFDLSAIDQTDTPVADEEAYHCSQQFQGKGQR